MNQPSTPPSTQPAGQTGTLTVSEREELVGYFLRGSSGDRLVAKVEQIVDARSAQAVQAVIDAATAAFPWLDFAVSFDGTQDIWTVSDSRAPVAPGDSKAPEHAFIAGGPKNERGLMDPRPSCACGAVMEVGIKTSPAGWYRSHLDEVG